MMLREARVDRVRLRLDKKTVRRDAASGYARILGRAVGANQFLTYGRADGRDTDTHVEFVPRETVNDSEAIFSLKMKPATFHHPPEMLTSRNTSRHQIGSVVEVEFRDGNDGLWTELLITDGATLDSVDEGVVELSLAYTAEIDSTPGEFEGRHFDSVQHKRLYNHIAIVPEGRAGSENRLQLDAISPKLFDAAGLAIQILEDPMKTIKVDGKDVEVADEVAAAFEKIDSDFQIFKKKKEEEDEAKAKAKAAKDKEARDAKADDPSKEPKKDALTVDLDALGDKVVEKLDARRTSEEKKDAARRVILADAKPMLPKSYSFDGKTNDQVMVDAIVAGSPDSKNLADGAKGAELVGMFKMAQTSKPAERKPLGDAGSGKPQNEERDIFKEREDKARELFFDKKLAGVEAMRHGDMKKVGSK